MREHKNFWDRNAGRYDRFMRKDRAAYDEMYELIRPVVKAKTVLELATGTGLIAKHIVNAAAHIEATDASAEMIAEAKRDNADHAPPYPGSYQLGIRPGHLGGRALSLSDGLSGTARCKGRLLVRRKRRAYEKGHPATAEGISGSDRPLLPRFWSW